MKTEEEARKHRCIGPGNCGGSTLAGDINRYCVGSACGMGWRHEREWGPDSDDRTAQWGMQPTGRGYCGLAGTP